MSFASHFRVKAELYQLLLNHSRETKNAIDQAWYESLVRSYTLLAASEDRHYHTGLKAVPASQAPLAVEDEPRKAITKAA